MVIVQYRIFSQPKCSYRKAASRFCGMRTSYPDLHSNYWSSKQHPSRLQAQSKEKIKIQ